MGRSTSPIPRYLLPSRRQWRDWSTPSKVGYLGFGIGLVSLIITISPYIYDMLVVAFFQRPVEIGASVTPHLFDIGISRSMGANEIRDRRIFRLLLENPNNFSMRSLECRLQWPEPILAIQVGDRPVGSAFEAAPIWDRQPIAISGNVEPDQVVEPFGDEQITGIWRFTVAELPAMSTMEIDIVTLCCPSQMIYADSLRELDAIQKETIHVWYASLSYNMLSGEKSLITKKNILFGVNRTERNVFISHSLTSMKDTTFAQLRQGKGLRLVGIAKLRGYLFAQYGSKFSFSGPLLIESEEKIQRIRFGLLGPDLQPGLEVLLKPHPILGTVAALSNFPSAPSR